MRRSNELREGRERGKRGKREGGEEGKEGKERKEGEREDMTLLVYSVLMVLRGSPPVTLSITLAFPKLQQQKKKKMIKNSRNLLKKETKREGGRDIFKGWGREGKERTYGMKAAR